MKSTLRGRAALSVTLVLLAFGISAATVGAAEEYEKYGVESVSASLSTTLAGAHADLTTSFKLTRDLGGIPFARTRDIEVALPPGMIGNPQGVPQCTVAQLGNLPAESECPVDSQVGITEVTLIDPVSGTFTEPVYNMPSPGGDIVARLGFFAFEWPLFLNVRLDPNNYGLVAAIEGVPSGANMLEATTTLWGIPAAKTHDELRITPEEAASGDFPSGGREATLPEAPFLSNPTDCSTQRQISVTARSYQLPNSPSTMTAPFPNITGCGKLSFDPTFTAVPTNPEASAPTGLDAELQIPQDETPQGRATSTLKSAVITLPEGLAINSAAGQGLRACTADEVGVGRNESAHCPDAAKIGSVTMDVPALEETLKGSVYQRAPDPGRLFGFWLVADEQGVHLKLPAEIQPNPLTGQLTTVFAGIPALGGNPQVPVASFKFHIFDGPRAPLATPAACGTYQTHYSLTPWSGQAPAEGDTAMGITRGCDTGGFAPEVSAGSLISSAGKFSPFAFTLTRADGEANPRILAVHLPQGLLAKLGGVTLCPEGVASTGNCPIASKIGDLTAAAGVGGAPLWIPQPGKTPTASYLAGPYKGAPYSIVSVIPAQAGPFDLGTVVNRAMIDIDPESALVTIKTDPLPQILEGVPLNYRAIHVDVDRPKFTLNPTSCALKTITATVAATNGLVAEPRTGFQVTNCGALGYKPKLKLRFKGATKRSGHPAVKAVLTQGANQANTKSASVILPVSEMIDQDHINNPCTRIQFKAGQCPKKSVLGHASATTPLLDEPLRGPIYFRSNGGARDLPDIVADLHGPINIVLVGYVDAIQLKNSESSRIRTRFARVPDAPVSRFTMNFFGGKRGLLEHNRDICRSGRRAKLHLQAQNGMERKVNSVIATDCGRRR